MSGEEKKDEKPKIEEQKKHSGSADYGLKPVPTLEKRDEPVWNPDNRVDL